MTELQYIKLTSFFRKTKLRENIMKCLCKFTPLIVVLIYLFSLVFLFINKNDKLLMFTFVPASNFIFITILRKVLNKPRPYDLFNHVPLVSYTKGKGKSFPSRHTSSAFIIAISYFYIGSIPLGLFMIFIAFIIGLSRVVAGVHFLKDIIAATLISILWSCVYLV
ncbi:phosphatase PAP2 family protein [uncultured Clostridium sp.]|uniref:phosphatase PAP2 family protein n=1 Tax=uncultured Clostridium sp. TaxID=59620 RepID=UPI0025FD6D23|nr:phosphatase PAP2 family protein [uncultured Clostridium sp.]